MNRRPFQKQTRNAFTLIELLLVLVILAVLAAVVVPRFSSRRKQANETAAKTQISAFETSLNQFEIDCGRFPTTDEGLDALVTNKANLDGWNQYMKKVPADPWGKPYIYRSPGTKNQDFDVLSGGEDGREGTEDDITN
jgi:general secretion pathway protein G